MKSNGASLPRTYMSTLRFNFKWFAEYEYKRATLRAFAHLTETMKIFDCHLHSRLLQIYHLPTLILKQSGDHSQKSTYTWPLKVVLGSCSGVHHATLLFFLCFFFKIMIDKWFYYTIYTISRFSQAETKFGGTKSNTSIRVKYYTYFFWVGWFDLVFSTRRKQTICTLSRPLTGPSSISVLPTVSNIPKLSFPLWWQWFILYVVLFSIWKLFSLSFHCVLKLLLTNCSSTMQLLTWV